MTTGQTLLIPHVDGDVVWHMAGPLTYLYDNDRSPKANADHLREITRWLIRIHPDATVLRHDFRPGDRRHWRPGEPGYLTPDDIDRIIARSPLP